VTALATATLAALADRASVPAYDRGSVTPGVVHLGVGGFHRAHQALYLDRVMQETGDLSWGISGVGVLAQDAAMQRALAAQDRLFTVVEKHGDGREALRVVGALVEYLLAPDDPGAVVARLAAPSTRIVTLTITEGGYAVEPAASGPTAFGLLCDALRRRREEGTPAFTVVSCDNLPANGRLAREALLAHARAQDAPLADWIAQEVRFPSSMVDRITPQTTDEDRAQLAERHGIEDRWPVVCEPFSQWVLEDDFAAGRPALERVGVQLVDDVEPYELMKLRLLNGSHQALGYLGYLAGHRLVHEAAQDPRLEAFVRGYMDAEATPTLPAVPGIDLDDYKATLIERFSNPHVRDTLARLCAHSSDRIPAWVLPVVRARLAEDGDVSRCAAVVAAWARYCEGTDEVGAPIEIVDACAEALSQRARRQRAEPTAFLEDPELFGDLAEDPRFVTPYLHALHSLHEHGARATLEHLIGSPHG